MQPAVGPSDAGRDGRPGDEDLAVARRARRACRTAAGRRPRGRRTLVAPRAWRGRDLRAGLGQAVGQARRARRRRARARAAPRAPGRRRSARSAAPAGRSGRRRAAARAWSRRAMTSVISARCRAVAARARLEALVHDRRRRVDRAAHQDRQAADVDSGSVHSQRSRGSRPSATAEPSALQRKLP